MKDRLGKGTRRDKGHEMGKCLVFSRKGKEAKVNELCEQGENTGDWNQRGHREQVPERKKFEFNVN